MWEPTVQGGTVRGPSGASGGPVHAHVESASSRGSEPSSAPGPMVRGVKTSSGGTRSSASVTSGPAEVSQPGRHVKLSYDLKIIIIFFFFQFNPFIKKNNDFNLF